MRDLTEQLSRYATWVGDRVEPVALEEIDARIQQRDTAPGSPLALESAIDRPSRRPILVAVAAAVIIAIASIGAVLLIDDDDSTDVATSPDGSSGDDTFGHVPGWTELDGGPLEPRKGAVAAWTGTELIMIGGVGHTNGAAYDPHTRTWRTITDPPFPVGGSMYPTAVWTGEEVLVIRRNLDGGDPAPLEFAAYDPVSDSWRRLADPPATTGAPQGLLWTGSEAILTGPWAAYDPDSDSWRPIDLGAPPPDAGVAWTGGSLVVASPGSPTVIHELATGETTTLDAAPDHGIDSTGGSVGAVAIGESVITVDESGRASRLDLDAGTWSAEADGLRTSKSPCIPAGWALADGSSVWDLCERMWLRSADGDWSHAGPSRIGCCMRATVSTGAALLAWISSDDTANDPAAPYKSLWAWVPGASTTATTDPPRDRRSGPPPNPNHPTYGYEPGWHDFHPGPLEARVEASTLWANDALFVLGGLGHTAGASYSPLSGRWSTVPSPGLEPGWNRTAQLVSTGLEVIVVRASSDGDDGTRRAMSYSRYNRTWRDLPDAPPFLGGPSAMVWTGSEVLLVDSHAAFDPATDTWRSIDLPTVHHEAAVVWTGEVLVLVAPGDRTAVYDPVSDSTTFLDPPPDQAMNIRGGFVGGASAYGSIIVVDEAGRASSLDLAAGTWQEEAVLDLGDRPCRPEGHALDDGRSIWELCGRTWIRSFDGTWAEDHHAAATCCLRGSGNTGTFLLNWWSDGQDAALRLWVPPAAPAPRVHLADGTHEGFIQKVELGVDRHLITVDLMEFFFDAEAAEMAMADGAIDHPDGLANPYYVRSAGLPPVLLDASPQAGLWALDEGLVASQVVEWEEFAAAHNERRITSPNQIQVFPVELDVRDGVVVEIRQFYVP